jgi:transcriptional regulator with XRE-family HTH domain
MIGVTHMTISKIESGKFNFGIDIFNKLSIALGFKLELILKDDKQEKGRFDLLKNNDRCILIDKETGIRIVFFAKDFNASQKIVMPANFEASVSDLATIMRLAGEWLFLNYPNVL